MKGLFSFLKSDIARIICALIFFVTALIFGQKVNPCGELALYIAALIISGGKVFVDAVRGILRRDLLDEKFLMSIASIGAMIVGEWSEGVAVMLFFLVGEYFEHKAVRRSRNAIKSLMDICPDTATVIVDGELREEYAEDVEVGAMILIRSGERVPLDCEVTEGECELDTSALTGESVPVHAKEGSIVRSGTIVLGGTIYARTVCTYENSSAARILSLVESAQERKSREENFISTFSRYYTPIVTALAGFPSVGYAAHTIMHHLDDYGNTRFEMGYASAIATILFFMQIGANAVIRKLLSKVGK